MATVRFATNDVLVQNQVALGVAPTCTESAKTVTCSGGSATDGAAISSVSDASQPDTLTVTVGGTTLFQGSITDIVDRAARPTS